MSNRRQESRYQIEPLEILVDLTADIDTGFTAHLLSNLSLGGAFIRLEHPLPVGAPVRFQAYLPFPRRAQLAVVGTVVWSRTAEQAHLGGGTPGIGVRFDEVNPEGLEALKHFVMQLVEDEMFHPMPEDQPS